ncbi:MAG TPA: 50S ribosomal protein L21 [Candidatus Dormibacteraeota bacterium]|nr:50S ribosomal protein L21 [Candidatus Dormibacteraeota bacterium]
MPKPDGPLSAVVLSGGKQYRVAPGDRILVDRLSAEPGASIKLGRLVLFSNSGDVKVGSALEGLDVDAKVLAHRRGPRTESLRYKSKKRVRVHRGGRSYLTALEIIAVGGVGLEKPETEEAAEEKPKRGRAKAAPKKKADEPKAEATSEKKPARRRTKKEEAE